MSNYPPFPIEYVAGFFDGEGCVTIYQAKKNKRDIRVHVAISQRCDNAQILFWLKSLYGGGLYLAQNGKKNPRWSDVYTWSVSLRKAEKFLKDIEPHVHIKKRQVELALRMMSERRPRGGFALGAPWKTQVPRREGGMNEEKYAEQMRALNSSRPKASDFPMQ